MSHLQYAYNKSSSQHKEKKKKFQKKKKIEKHYCTPNGFNWEHGVTQDLPDGDGPPPIVKNPPSHSFQPNDYDRAKEFVELARSRVKDFRTNNILIPFGCDFTYQNANQMFKNMDKLIEAVNHYTDLQANVRYSTLSDYAAHVKELMNFPTHQEDFFPYMDEPPWMEPGFFFYYFCSFF
eukprot:Lithocolla_globosa_v1_NODE_831_length_3216_cov_37.534641.p2 type:complete len:179 gc:universal NODE_831_length_3216_cov_37.534641:489-1025(+)